MYQTEYDAIENEYLQTAEIGIEWKKQKNLIYRHLLGWPTINTIDQL